MGANTSHLIVTQYNSLDSEVAEESKADFHTILQIKEVVLDNIRWLSSLCEAFVCSRCTDSRILCFSRFSLFILSNHEAGIPMVQWGCYKFTRRLKK